MNTSTVIAVIALAMILFLAIRYIVKEKKKGAKCIGCPYSGSCTKKKRDKSFSPSKNNCR